MSQETLRETLFALAEEEYRQFSAALLPGSAPLLGVRLPKLRRLAKDIVKRDWRRYLDTAWDDYFEEVMLQGIVIGAAPMELEERLERVTRFVPKISDWSVCDSFCIGLKFTLEHPARVWDFLQPYFQSALEFERRFALVMLIDFYIDEVYIERDLALLGRFCHSGYYARMAAAWALSICYARFPAQTLRCLERGGLDDFTYNKALQKILESRQVGPEEKRRIRGMKRETKNNESNCRK